MRVRRWRCNRDGVDTTGYHGGISSAGYHLGCRRHHDPSLVADSETSELFGRAEAIVVGWAVLSTRNATVDCRAAVVSLSSYVATDQQQAGRRRVDYRHRRVACRWKRSA